MTVFYVDLGTFLRNENDLTRGIDTFFCSHFEHIIVIALLWILLLSPANMITTTLITLFLSIPIVSGALIESERLLEYEKRNYTYPFPVRAGKRCYRYVACTLF